MDSEKKPILHSNNSTNYLSFPDSTVNNLDQLRDEPKINSVSEKIEKRTQEKSDSETKVYKRRWYVLIIFSLMTFVQGGYWNTWGPIAASSEEAFGWTDADIALLSNWGPITYLVSTLFFSWLIEAKGLRVATLSAALLVAAGAGVRCITDKPPYVTWAVNIGQLLNGLGGPVAMGAPPALSSTWFPPHERTTATAMAAMMNCFGSGISFLIGPYFVSEKHSYVNSTSNKNKNITSDCISVIDTNHSCHVNETETTSRIQRHEIMKLLYFEAVFAVAVFLMLLVYFPAKPKLPPSITASMDKFDFKTGFKKLMRNVRFWQICFIYGISVGVYGTWQSVLDVNLKPYNISENEAGWLGFYSVLASSTSSVIVARFADVFSKHMKFFLVMLNVGGVMCMIWFTIQINGFIPNPTVTLYTSVILGTLLIKATPALYYETACEITYPISEGVTNLILTLFNNVAGLVFLFVQMIPNIGTAWENWTVIGAILFCLPVLCMMKERYNRLKIDDNK